MELIQALLEKRSMKRYESTPVDRERIERIVKAGTYAPSTKGRQGTKIIAVTDKGWRDRLSELNRQAGGFKEGFDPFYGAPVVLVVLGDKSIENHVYDGSCVMDYLLLAAHAEGLGSCWIHRAKEVMDTAQGKALLDELGIEGEWEGIGNCVIGYPQGIPAEAKPRKSDFVYFVD